MGGILKYPEGGGLEFLSIPFVSHTTSGFVYDNNEEDNQDVLSDIRVPSIASNVIIDLFCYDYLNCDLM